VFFKIWAKNLKIVVWLFRFQKILPEIRMQHGKNTEIQQQFLSFGIVSTRFYSIFFQIVPFLRQNIHIEMELPILGLSVV
jgi:hypothetical protein